MPCDTVTRKNQNLSERVDEVRKVLVAVDKRIVSRLVRVRVGPQGAVVFDGVPDDERAGVTDACIYRRIMATGSALARQTIAQAERVAGRSVDRRVIAQGVHSHDGGRTWHGKG
jgi:hypothetical protein